MDIYLTSKKVVSKVTKLASIALLVSMPYLCDGGCAYSPTNANANEIKQQIQERNLETVLEKNYSNWQAK
jgi:hypothetical protein